MEAFQEDGIDRGEVRTVFSRKHSDIRANGKTMCKEHTWKKMNAMEIYCTQCPTVHIVNAEVLDELVK